MTSSALLTLIAIIASVEGGEAKIQGELLDALRPGDMGQVQYEITVGSEVRTIDAGTAEVVDVGGEEVTVRIVSERNVMAGFGVRFELPLARLTAEAAAPSDALSESSAERRDLRAFVERGGNLSVRVSALERELAATRQELATARESAEISGLIEALKTGDELAARLKEEREANKELRAQLAEVRAGGSTARLRERRAPATVEPEPAVPAPVASQLEARVRAWAAAWSAQDVEAYLDFYARAFRPAKGIGRAQWEVQRHQRLKAPEFLAVSIHDLELVASAVDRAEVRFDQNYRSNTLEDWVAKTLELVFEDGAWRIVAEASSPLQRRR